MRCKHEKYIHFEAIIVERTLYCACVQVGKTVLFSDIDGLFLQLQLRLVGVKPSLKKDNDVHEERTNGILRTRPSNDITVQQYTCLKYLKQTTSIVRFECADEYFRNSEKIFLL